MIKKRIFILKDQLGNTLEFLEEQLEMLGKMELNLENITVDDHGRLIQEMKE